MDAVLQKNDEHKSQAFLVERYKENKKKGLKSINKYNMHKFNI